MNSFVKDLLLVSVKNLSVQNVHYILEYLTSGRMILNTFYGNDLNIMDMTFKNFVYHCFELSLSSQNIMDNKKTYYNIIHLICRKVPKIITEEHFEVANKWRDRRLLRILSSYYKCSDREFCFICGSSHVDGLLSNVCKCRSVIHLECLVQTVEIFGEICGVCLENLGCKKNRQGIIYFPTLDIYYSNFHNRYIFSKSWETKFYNAICHLQKNRIKELMEQVPEETVRDFFSSEKFIWNDMKDSDFDKKVSEIWKMVELKLNK